MTKIAFIGLGNMGSGMCANLCKAGHEVRAFDLNADAVKSAVEKGAATLLMPVSARRQLYELSDEMATKVDVQFYSDVRDALLKALVE